MASFGVLLDATGRLLPGCTWGDVRCSRELVAAFGGRVGAKRGKWLLLTDEALGTTGQFRRVVG